MVDLSFLSFHTVVSPVPTSSTASGDASADDHSSEKSRETEVESVEIIDLFKDDDDDDEDDDDNETPLSSTLNFESTHLTEIFYYGNFQVFRVTVKVNRLLGITVGCNTPSDTTLAFIRHLDGILLIGEPESTRMAQIIIYSNG